MTLRTIGIGLWVVLAVVIVGLGVTDRGGETPWWEYVALAFLLGVSLRVVCAPESTAVTCTNKCTDAGN